MENLLNPDVGLMFWTVVTFLLLLIILKKTAWGPILKAIDAREEQMQQEADTAQKNRLAAQELRQEYENRLAEIEQRSRILIAQAEQTAAEKRDAMLQSAQQEVHALVEKTRLQLESEKNRLVQDLRQEVVRLSMQTTEKLLGKNIDASTQEKFVQDLVIDITSKS